MAGEASDKGTESLCRGNGEGMYIGESARNTGSPVAWLGKTSRRPVREPAGVAGWRRGPYY